MHDARFDFLVLLSLLYLYPKLRCCWISALVLTCFRLTKGCATFFRPETIVASFLHLMVLFYKEIFNHTSKHQFVVLHFCILHYSYVLIFIFDSCHNLWLRLFYNLKEFKTRNKTRWNTRIKIMKHKVHFIW